MIVFIIEEDGELGGVKMDFCMPVKRFSSATLWRCLINDNDGFLAIGYITIIF